MDHKTEQDAGLLEQAATMLEEHAEEQRARGNDSAAEGAACSAHAIRRLAPAMLRAGNTHPVLDDRWKARMLDGRAIERDEMGLGDHPELPWLDEGMMPRSFYAALALELVHTMAEDQLDGDALEAMSEAVNWTGWQPTAPQGDGWKLVSIFDTEDGPAAWWLRELPEAEDGTTTIRNLQAEVEKLNARIARAGAAPAAVAGPGYEDLRKALQFYANGEHFILSERDTSWDTVSGEPQNYWCDEAGTATVEDGTIAKMALAGQPIDFEDDDAAPEFEAPGATDAAIDAIVLCETGFDGDGYQAMTADELRRIVRSALGELAAAPQAPAPVEAPAVDRFALAAELRLLSRVQDDQYPNFRAILNDAALALEGVMPAPAGVPDYAGENVAERKAAMRRLFAAAPQAPAAPAVDASSVADMARALEMLVGSDALHSLCEHEGIDAIGRVKGTWSKAAECNARSTLLIHRKAIDAAIAAQAAAKGSGDA